LVSPTSTFVPSFEAPKIEIDNSSQYYNVPAEPTESYAFPCSPLTRLSSSERVFPLQQPPQFARQASYKSATPVPNVLIDDSSTHTSSGLGDAPIQPSFGESPRHSVLLSYAPSIRESFGSIASTASSDAGHSPKEIAQQPVPIISDVTYSTLLPSAETPHDPDRVPTINRESWQVDLGLSPRSTPSPIAAHDEVVAQPLDLDEGYFFGASERSKEADREDTKTASQEPNIDSFKPLSRRMTGGLITETIEEEEPEMRDERADSAMSEAFEFPLPPSRDGSIIEFNGSSETIHVLEADQDTKNICLDTPKQAFEFSMSKPQPMIASRPSSPKSSPILDSRVVMGDNSE
jgi:hypothetical protein